MGGEDIAVRIESKGIRSTANRILVFKTLLAQGRPMALADFEALMPSMDKSSIFRVLNLFLDRDVVHAFEDGRGVLHYELCHEDGHCSHHDSHFHFYCEECRQSFCLEDIRIPDIVLPEGFLPHSISFVIKGICPDCREKGKKVKR